MNGSVVKSFVNRYAPNLSSAVRPLTSDEKKQLIENCNSAECWDTVNVSEGFSPSGIQHCRFFGIVVLGGNDNSSARCQNFSIPRGLYNSTIGNTIIGRNVTINSVLYCNFYSIGDNVILHNIGELFTTDFARFGHGACVNSRYEWIHLINENGGRAVLPFDGMLPADSFIWSKYRNDHELLDKLTEITNTTSQPRINTIGKICPAAIVKNSKIIKNSYIGDSAIVNGAEILDNVSIRSTAKEPTEIGAGVQLRDSIVGIGNKIDSASQLHSVITGNQVSIHQTARISHSFIGDNSAISCCEIAHSLLFPSHGQHHNNSFLIASMIGGQSNIAAGATIGSNHNSRTNDGELWASRGFWPGLCTSFKHNSRFASYSMCVKADYPSELDIPFPFSLIINDPVNDNLVIHPAYWFTKNMYSFVRSKEKFEKRDKRISREQNIEHNPLAPDTIEEIFQAIDIIETETGKGWFAQHKQDISASEYQIKGRQFLEAEDRIPDLEVKGRFEKSKRVTLIKNPSLAWRSYNSIIRWYATRTIIEYSAQTGCIFSGNSLPERDRSWVNCGGQIISQIDLDSLLNKIKHDQTIKTWDTIHEYYNELYNKYNHDKYLHALGCIAALDGINENDFTTLHLQTGLQKSIPVFTQIPELTRRSRTKDYSDHFRMIAYSSKTEMEAVLGNVDDDSVIITTEQDTNKFINDINHYCINLHGE